jgi:Cof subfamily protein (haloacid dehalogenase superfamily)
MIRLVAIDLDGTMLSRERQIPERNKMAVQAASQAGVMVVLASGRIAPSMRPFADQLGLNGAMICSNGAHVTGRSGEELLHLGLDAETTETVLGYAEANGVHLNVYSRSTLRFLAESLWGEVYKSRVTTIEHQVLTPAERASLSPTKMMLVAAPAELAFHREALAGRIDPERARMVISEPEYLEILAASASKATGLEKLASACGIDRSEVAAIGDYLNDLEMIQWAGLSGAVANAAPEVIAAARVTVSSNEDAGVAEFIFEHVLKS